MVKDRVLNHAITAAYQGFGEGQLFPAVFLFVDLPPHEIDVNVHPAKTEVRFVQADFVHNHVRDTLRAALVERKLTIPYRFREANHENPSVVPIGRNDPWRKPGQPQTQLPFAQQPTGAGTIRPMNPSVEEHPRQDSAPNTPLKPFEQFLARQDALAAPAQHQEPGQGTNKPPAQPTQETGLFPADPKLSLPRIIGQFRESYILAEQEGDLLLIDQHVAHERILYDQITSELAADQVQRQALLVPLTVELSPQQSVMMERLLPHIRKFGFDLDAFDGNTYLIREVPVSVMHEPIERMVSELVDKVQGVRPDSC